MQGIGFKGFKARGLVIVPLGFLTVKNPGNISISITTFSAKDEGEMSLVLVLMIKYFLRILVFIYHWDYAS